MFDGASRRRECGCGAIIYLDLGIHFHFWWEGGQGTNNKTKIMALWGVMLVTKWLSIEKITVFDDRKVIIDWVNDFTKFTPSILENWMRSIVIMTINFQEVQLQHIYREQNWRADVLSKRGISKVTSNTLFTKFTQGKLVNEGLVSFS